MSSTTHTTSYNNHQLYLTIHSDKTTLTYTFPTDTLTVEQIATKYTELDSIWHDIGGQGTDNANE